MTKKDPLRGIILSVVDERGPHPILWYPNFAELVHIHNSSVKSFSIMIGDKSYREKSLFDLTCFGILPFPDIDSIGLIHFFGVEKEKTEKGRHNELPTTLTLIFEKSFMDKLCQNSPKLHQFLERETKSLWPSIRHEDEDSKMLSQLYDKIKRFLENV